MEYRSTCLPPGTSRASSTKSCKADAAFTYRSQMDHQQDCRNAAPVQELLKQSRASQFNKGVEPRKDLFTTWRYLDG